MNITRYMAISAILFSIISIAGCGSGGRVVRYALGVTPTATSSQIEVRVAEIERATDSVIVRLAIANPTSDPVIFARSYGVFTAATLVHGINAITGVQVPKQPRTSPPYQYTILAKEDAVLSLDFRAPGIDRATDLSLIVRGSTHGVDQTWTITIPPEPSLPAATNP